MIQLTHILVRTYVVLVNYTAEIDQGTKVIFLLFMVVQSCVISGLLA